ncbi:MAG: histidine kinase [Gammaproteobacteria bacterium]|nr:histidine kinase [Gammaproteobacteria bacterium]
MIQRRDKVKGPILIPFSLLLVLAVGALFLIAYLYEEKARQQDLATSMRAAERLFGLQIDNDAARLHAALCPISRNEAVAKAFLNGDRGALLAKIGPLFSRLRDLHRVTHFYLLDTDRRVVLRVHKPAMRDDVIDRFTTLKAEQSGRETQGIELGPLGTLTLRAVKPWRFEGQLIGYLELGEEIGHIGDEIHRALGVDLLVTVNQAFLGSEGLLAGTTEASDFVVVSNTLDEVPPFVAKRLGGLNRQLQVSEASVYGDISLYTAVLPLNDAAGREIGDIVVIRDVTKLQAGFRESLVAAASLSLLAGALVFGLFYVILDRVERDYRRQREMETQFARLSTEHQRIVQIEKLSEVGRTISEIAHQINNPLVGVVNMAQLAEREADDPVRVRELLADIRQAGADSHAFLQRMLAFTKVSRFERKPTEMSNLIEETIALFQQSTDRHPAITTELSTSSLMLDLDPVLIRHALFNLLSNASQVNAPDGRITVRLRQSTGPDMRRGWSLEVGDEGPGLSKEVQDKLFTPFFTTQPSGTGLGLAVVQHVAMLHDGRATGENQSHGGAVFALWIPEHPRDQEAST